jgi:Amidohydrolase
MPMRAEDLILVSVDDHIVEPPEMFEGRLPAKYQDLAPRLERKPDGTDVWRYDGSEIPNIGLNAVVGRPPEEYGIEPTSLDQMRPGCFDVHERVRDMNANGVLGSMCFPSFPQFCGQLFARTADKDVALAMIRAYNDWHIEGWCGAEPGRFIPLSLPVLWDPALAADEVRRVAGRGCHAVTFSENPEKLGWPSFHSDHWDPFWQACADEGTVVCLHIGSSSQLVVTSVEAPIDVMISLQPMNVVQAAADLLWSPVLRKFPDLRIALSEGGIGWIPYLLERVDYVYEHHRAWTGQDFGSLLPSQLFKERIVTCFIDDAFGVDNRRYLNLDNITWECDYPHSDSTWPHAPESAMKYLADVPDDEIDKITHLNAMRIFAYDPFSIRPRQRCTVEALRAEATDVDLSLMTRSAGGHDRPKGPVTLDLSSIGAKSQAEGND